VVRDTVGAMRTYPAYWIVAVLSLGCGSKDAKPTQEPPAGSATITPGSAAPAAAPGIEIFVDGKSVGSVGRDQLATWPRLDTLVPEDSRRLGTWRTVAIAGRAPAEIETPSMTHPDMIPAVFPGDDGAPAFGMFDPVELAKRGKPGVRHDGVTQIRIALAAGDRGGDHRGGEAGGDPLALVVTIKTPRGEQQLTGEQILALPREPMPGSEDTHKGWRVTQLLEAAGIEDKYKKLVLVDAGGTNLTLERSDFDDKTAIPFLKLNKSGALRFRLMKQQGTGWQAAGDLRALAAIKVD
jgi:hypothetical protein